MRRIEELGVVEAIEIQSDATLIQRVLPEAGLLLGSTYPISLELNSQTLRGLQTSISCAQELHVTRDQNSAKCTRVVLRVAIGIPLSEAKKVSSWQIDKRVNQIIK